MPLTVRAFSLFELIVAMAIVAILATIAYPTYHYSLIKTHRNQAEVDLLKIAERLEEFHDINNTYQGVTFDQLDLIDHTRYYTYSLHSLTKENYLLKATPYGNQFQDDCGILWFSAKG